jgi:2-dehydro-3-deoxy-D-arabinonate dehydratase
MNDPLLLRYSHPDLGPRLALLLGDSLHDVTGPVGSVSAWLRRTVGRVEEAVEELVQTAAASSTVIPLASIEPSPDPGRFHWLAPIDEQDVWAAGVTYARSRVARQKEAIDGGDVYAKVYEADRPEIFFKARGPWVVGPFGKIGIRRDSAWSVPEPELGLVINPGMEVVGLVIGNDVSSRDIEGENLLYIPQAKIYTASCSLGPGILLGPHTGSWPAAAIRIEIKRAGEVVFQGETRTERIHRTMDDLVGYLGRSLKFPDGVVLLTGTGVVPPDDFTLQPGDVVEIAIDGLGLLENRVIQV